MVSISVSPSFSLEDYMHSPPDRTEWIDGKLVEKGDMTFRHSATQARIVYYWRSYVVSNAFRGEVLTEAPCRCDRQGRRPDVAHITPELLEQYGEFNVLPVSFPLVAEVASLTDLAEDFFAKATEYLNSGCQEVWLVLPKNRWLFVIIPTQKLWFGRGDTVSSPVVLQGLRIAVDELLA